MPAWAAANCCSPAACATRSPAGPVAEGSGSGPTTWQRASPPQRPARHPRLVLGGREVRLGRGEVRRCVFVTSSPAAMASAPGSSRSLPAVTTSPTVGRTGSAGPRTGPSRGRTSVDAEQKPVAALVAAFCASTTAPRLRATSARATLTAASAHRRCTGDGEQHGRRQGGRGPTVAGKKPGGGGGARWAATSSGPFLCVQGAARPSRRSLRTTAERRNCLGGGDHPRGVTGPRAGRPPTSAPAPIHHSAIGHCMTPGDGTLGA